MRIYLATFFTVVTLIIAHNAHARKKIEWSQNPIDVMVGIGGHIETILEFTAEEHHDQMNDPAASCGVSKRWLRPENQRFSDLKIPFETKQASGNQTHSD